MGLTSRTKRVAPGGLIAQWLKRVTSMLNKLAREPHMKLSQMQDLGGCRAIVPDVAAVAEFRISIVARKIYLDLKVR
jgi:hypothetical protein